MPGELPENTDIGRESCRACSPAASPLRHREVEAAAAVADVEQHAALLRAEAPPAQLAVLDDVGELPAVFGKPEKQCSGCRPAQRVQDLHHQLRRGDAADVAHHAGVRRRSRRRGSRASARGCPLVDDVPDMRTLDAIAMSAFSATVRPAPRDARSPRWNSSGSGNRRGRCSDMHEGVQARARLRRDVAPEAAKLFAPGVPAEPSSSCPGTRSVVRGMRSPSRTDRRASQVGRVGSTRPPEASSSSAKATCTGMSRPRSLRSSHAADADVAPSAQLLARMSRAAAP